MTDLVTLRYDATGASATADAMGMRPMQRRVYDHRNSQYLLVKAPPASGKSRALMFNAIDKVANQGIRKVIVAVPERSIGSSFRSTPLKKDGYIADWTVVPRWDLCTAGNAGKSDEFAAFMASPDHNLVCTHATLRTAVGKLGIESFDECLVAIDEFHHASSSEESRLGDVVRGLKERGSAHMIAMTGSYFRGDTAQVLRPEDEADFDTVTYTYYEQLNGYEYLKTLGIGYHFYRGRYTDAISEILDLSKKTIIHIPSVNARESLKDKFGEVDRIHDAIGTLIPGLSPDPATGFYHLRTADGRTLKVADLVDDGPGREKVLDSLRNVKDRADVDIIVALGMAKEGFDWPWCEVALTIGYRGSLTEVIQIIGRATRDAPGKAHAQFTNLIAQPDATDEKVRDAVNDMLKAIAVSLLMEAVMTPVFKFKTKKDSDQIDGTSRTGAQPDGIVEIAVNGLAEPTTKKAKDAVEKDMQDLVASVVADDLAQKLATTEGTDAAETLHGIVIPTIVKKRYPTMDEAEVQAVSDAVSAKLVVGDAAAAPADAPAKAEAGDEQGKGAKDPGERKGGGEDNRFINFAAKITSVHDLHMDLIRQVNPFQRAFEVISKNMDAPILKRIHETVRARNNPVTEEEVLAVYPKVKQFVATNGREPSLTSGSTFERRLAEVLAAARDMKAKRDAAKRAEA